MSGANRSTAVMQRRLAGLDGIDDFPTQPWGTRSLIERGPVDFGGNLNDLTVWEPCAGRRTMSRILEEYNPARLIETDVTDYGGPNVSTFDFRKPCDRPPSGRPDWVITNPPFKHALEMWLNAWEVALVGVAFLLRTSWIEGEERYFSLFQHDLVRFVCPFASRLPLVRGHLNAAASSATSYAWFVGLKAERRPRPEVHIIPPCRAALERPGDYDGWPNQYRVVRDPDTDAELIIPLTDALGTPINNPVELPPLRRQLDLLASE